jgi:A/G-specific adenine glycosylase
VVTRFEGALPDDPGVLIGLPGIGPGTAGSLAAFVYNKPAVFIETNIRRVFLHFFFEGRDGIRDAEILPLVAESLDREAPRDWYYGLMDYGVYLKSLYPNPNRRSAHYSRQSKFEGSHRQIRGRIIALLSEGGKGSEARGYLSAAEMVLRTGFSLEGIQKAVAELTSEGFVAEASGEYGIVHR